MRPTRIAVLIKWSYLSYHHDPESTGFRASMLFETIQRKIIRLFILARVCDAHFSQLTDRVKRRRR
jgi:DNA-binding sugar fermentation-stimulating protein